MMLKTIITVSYFRFIISLLNKVLLFKDDWDAHKWIWIFLIHVFTPLSRGQIIASVLYLVRVIKANSCF